MNESWLKTEPVLEKVLTAIRDNEEAREAYKALAHAREGGKDLEYATILGLGNANGNYLFTNYPEVFGITKQEAHEMRSHFQNYQLREESEKEEKDHFAEMQKLIDEYFPKAILN